MNFPEINTTLLWWIIGFILFNLLFLVVSWFVGSYCAYTATLRRKEGKWNREMPEGLDHEALRMYEMGREWHMANADKKTDVHIVRDGLNLYGEYYDFGSDRCVFILSGRTESLTYGYYFAIPYAENGCNVLVVDPRAHGLSEGMYNTVGFEESKDAIAWIEHITEKFGVRSVVLHGICIGAAGGMFALTSGRCSDVIDGIVTEGMFPNFNESVRNHMIEQKRSTFVTLNLIDFWMRHFTGHSMKYGPLDVIDKLDKPLLMLHSREDLYSTPEYAEKLYARAGCDEKRLVWFEHGRHSMLRITDTELYDRSIAEFLATLPSKADIS
jgi:alpha-beta hydrolase superfamily lysophospholipase